MTRTILLVTVFALGGALAGCSSDDVGTEATRDTIERAGNEAQEAAREGMAGLRTDVERFVDDVQTRNAPEAKQRLLDRCRDELERLRKASSESAERVAAVCDRIQNTDITNPSAWTEIKQEIEKLP